MLILDRKYKSMGDCKGMNKKVTLKFFLKSLANSLEGRTENEA